MQPILSNPDIQIFKPTGAKVIVDFVEHTRGDERSVEGVNGKRLRLWELMTGVRVSPDGRFLASVDISDGITIASMTNGIPDDNSIFGIKNSPNVNNARGMDWDAADNVYVSSSGQGLMRTYSLGLTTTCITSNDVTGTNGSFRLVLPPVTTSVVATTPQGSHNYINNSSPGTPIPAVFTITLSTNALPLPVVVNYTLSGTALSGTNYTVAPGPDANGIVYTPPVKRDLPCRHLSLRRIGLQTCKSFLDGQRQFPAPL